MTFGAPAFGAYQVRGEIAGIEKPVVFTGGTSSYPWALPVLGLLLTVGVSVRRKRPKPAEEPTVTVVCPHCDGEVPLRVTTG